jgi:hypothetical protein
MLGEIHERVTKGTARQNGGNSTVCLAADTEEGPLEGRTCPEGRGGRGITGSGSHKTA